MAFSELDTEIIYTGDGVDSTFEIPFPYAIAAYIHLEYYDETDPDNVLTIPMVKDTDWEFVDDETIRTIELVVVGPDLVPTALPLPNGVRMRIYRETVDNHPTNYNTYQFPYQTVNFDTDKIYQRLQELRRDVSRAISLNALSLEDGSTLSGEDILEAISTLQTLIDNLATGAGLPTGGAAGDFLEKVLLPTEGAEWKSGQFEGFSARFNESISTTSLQDAINTIFNFSYLAPLLSLSCSPSQGVREKGTSVAAVTMTATATKRSEDITQIRHYRNGVLVETELAPNPAGGSDVFVESTPFTDTMTFYARVDDGTSTVQSNTVTYSYAYPYYEGKGAAGLDATGIVANLTKVVRASTANVGVTTSPTNEHFYFCYPSAYPALTSVLDPNGFETIADYTVRSVTITGLDGTPQSYRVYEFTLPTTQVAFTNTYKR